MRWISAAASVLAIAALASACSGGDRTVEITYDKEAITAGQVLGLVQDMGLVIEDVTTREADLEDVFVEIMRSGAPMAAPSAAPVAAPAVAA